MNVDIPDTRPMNRMIGLIEGYAEYHREDVLQGMTNWMDTYKTKPEIEDALSDIQNEYYASSVSLAQIAAKAGAVLNSLPLGAEFAVYFMNDTENLEPPPPEASGGGYRGGARLITPSAWWNSLSSTDKRWYQAAGGIAAFGLFSATIIVTGWAAAVIAAAGAATATVLGTSGGQIVFLAASVAVGAAVFHRYTAGASSTEALAAKKKAKTYTDKFVAELDERREQAMELVAPDPDYITATRNANFDSPTESSLFRSQRGGFALGFLPRLTAKPAAKKPVAKPPAKKPVAKPAAKKPAAKPAAKKPVAKPAVKPVAKKTVSKRK